MVQPVPQVTLGCWGTPAGGGRWGPVWPQGGQEHREGAGGQGLGFGQGGRQEAAPASGSPRLPSCAVMGDATQADTGLGELSASRARI